MPYSRRVNLPSLAAIHQARTFAVFAINPLHWCVSIDVPTKISNTGQPHMKPTFLYRVLAIVLAAWTGAASAEQAAFASPKSFDFLGFNATILLSGADTGGTSAMMKIQYPANTGPPAHIHTREDEVYLIKRGTFQFFMDGVCLQAGPGDALYMPKGHTHTFKNISKHTGEHLMMIYPAGLEQFFLDVHKLGLKIPQDFAKLNELSNSKYGVNLVPGHDFKAGVCKKVGADRDSDK